MKDTTFMKEISTMISKFKKWLEPTKDMHIIERKPIPKHIHTDEEEQKVYELEGKRYILESVTRYLLRNYPFLDIYGDKPSEAALKAMDLGTKLHSDIQNYLEGKQVLSEDDICMSQFKDFMSSVLAKSKLEGCEIEIWSPNLKLKGIVDAIFIDEDGGVVVVDWKRSFSVLNEKTLLKNKLQVATYAKILSDFYGVEVKKCMVVAFHPKFDRYKYWSFTPKRVLDTRTGSMSPSIIEVDTMSTYGDFIRQTEKYIIGHEKTRKSTFLESMDLPREIILAEFMTVQDVKMPVVEPVKLTKEILEHPYLEDILESGYCKVNEKDLKMQTPLMNAALYGNLRAAELLIKNGAEVNNQNVYRFTPLLHAIINDNEDVAKLLIDNGADINYVYDNMTMYDFAVMKQQKSLCEYIKDRKTC